MRWHILEYGFLIVLLVLVFTESPLLETVENAYNGVFGLLLCGGLAISVVGGGFIFAQHLRRLRRLRQCTLDPQLRQLVGSESSWETCVLDASGFCAKSLVALRFMVEQEGFGPALILCRPNRLSYRRGEIGVEVREQRDARSVLLTICLFNSERSYRIAASEKREVFLTDQTDLASAVRAALAEVPAIVQVAALEAV